MTVRIAGRPDEFPVAAEGPAEPSDGSANSPRRSADPLETSPDLPVIPAGPPRAGPDSRQLAPGLLDSGPAARRASPGLLDSGPAARRASPGLLDSGPAAGRISPGLLDTSPDLPVIPAGPPPASPRPPGGLLGLLDGVTGTEPGTADAAERTTGSLARITGPLERIIVPPEGVGRWERLASAWDLLAILAAQVAMTLPWLWRTAPFTDEALYLEAGHQEWAHWLHHAAIADYASWFSGAPVLYPPLAAAADSAGGLAAARALSLVLMLASTALIYLTGNRLFGRLAGALAALLFAVCGLVVHYGAFATFGPPALFLLVVAAWAASRIRDGGYGWIAACAVALAAADATKYAALAWDPVIVGIIVLHGWDKSRWQALGSAASVAVTAGVLAFGMLMLGGADYSRGVIITTVFRSIHWNSGTSAGSVLLRALALTGLLAGPAILGVGLAAARRAPAATILLLCLLALGAVFAPVDQARIHQISSLDKNLGFGLPFAALGAGYALSTGRQWLGQRRRRGQLAATAICVALVLATIVAGRLQEVQFRGPGIGVASQVVSAVRSAHRPGTFIVSDGAARMEQYYLPSIPSKWWIGTFTPTPVQNARIVSRVCSGEVSVVVLRKDGSSYDHAYDRVLLRLLGRTGRYTLAAVAGQGNYSTQIWKLTGPGKGAGRGAGGCR